MGDDILIQRLLRYQHPTMDDAARRSIELKEENERLCAELESITKVPRSEAAYGIIQVIARHALIEQRDQS